ncbi:MAG: hypothetical protein LBB89_04540 [Treponema sp.]|nr:hypothetical protein [Treponema sp.]
MKKGIIAVMAIIFIVGFVGCVSYSHTQAIRNETGNTITEVYIRDTGTTDWGSVKNVEARRDSEGRVVYNWEGSVVWDTTNINNAAQVVFFRDSSSSETPRGMGNKDIIIKDGNGLFYMKNNVPITFTTTKDNLKDALLGGPSETLTTAAPITFTVQDRLPMLFVVNQTGYPLTLIAPIEVPINSQGRTQFQPMEMNRSINVTYRIGQATYTEQVTMKNEDATVNLTKRPPTITIVNNTGSTVDAISFKMPNAAAWEGGSIAISKDGSVHIGGARVAQTGDVAGRIINKDSMKLWLGNVNITGNTFDIGVDDVNKNSYVKSNVQVTNDMTLTFTQADKR